MDKSLHAGTESEIWDVDSEAIPQDIHDVTINSLLKKNEQLLKAHTTDKRDVNELTVYFETCATDADNQPVTELNDSNKDNNHSTTCDYDFVNSNPKKLFVTNINYKTSQYSLWQFFDGFGQVRYCQILRDHKGKSKGCGFVTFNDVKTTNLVLELQEEELCLDGRYLHVKPATYKKYRQSEDDAAVYTESRQNIQTDSSTCFIDALNDDMIVAIFTYLTLGELLYCERVCKRWKNLCHRRLQCLKHLSFEFLKTRFIWGFKLRHFEKLLRCVSPAVQFIDLSMMHNFLGNDAVKMIARYCPHLRCLNLSGLSITNPVLHDLAAGCPRLQTMKLNKCYRINHKGLWQLFKNCSQLEEIDIEENGLITGKSFNVAGSQLKRISASRCTKLQDIALKHLSSKCKQLKALNLSYCIHLSPEGIACLSQFSELEILNLSGSHTSVSLLKLEHLRKLKELYLAGNHTVTEEFLSSLGRFCPNIRIVDISDTNVRLGKIKNLCECKQLHVLKANNLQADKIGPDFIMDWSMLRVIHLQGCPDLTAADISYILMTVSTLEEFDIRHTDVGDAAIEILTEIRKAEPERNILLLTDDDWNEEILFQSDDELDDGLDDAYNFLDADDPLFAEQFELS